MKLKSNIAISNTGFLFDPNSGESYNINKTGQFILKLLSEKKEDYEIIQEVLKSYEGNPQIIQRFLDDFKMMLNQFNLIDKEA